MNVVRRFLGLGLVGLLLTGCIEQEVKIKLNADGSGTLTVRRYLSNMESGIAMLGDEVAQKFDTLQTVRHVIEKTTDTPPQKIQVSEYAFTNLAASLPELENLVPMMPRFSIQDDQLTVAVRREMDEYRGLSSESDTNNFYHLEIEFPAPPQSETGIIEGTHVAWKADQEQLKAFKKSKVGTVLFECSLPADAVQLDLKPRLVKEQKKKKLPGQKKNPKLVSSLSVTIPIVSEYTGWVRKDSNASMDLYLPVDPSQLPLCYENLMVKQLVIDGQNIIPELKSESSGVFSGTDSQGNEAPGIPVKLQFGWNSHLLKSIDRIDVSMNAAVPKETRSYSLDVDAAAATNSVFTFTDNPNERIAVLDIDHVFNQSAKLKLVTNLNPTDLSIVYLDTEYGLRYPAKEMGWKRGENISSIDQKLGENVFGKDTPFSIVEIYYPHIPTTSFQLTFVRVEELTMKKIVLSEENINVY